MALFPLGFDTVSGLAVRFVYCWMVGEALEAAFRLGLVFRHWTLRLILSSLTFCFEVRSTLVHSFVDNVVIVACKDTPAVRYVRLIKK